MRSLLHGRTDWETNFGSHDAFSLGVEEELLLVGADNELVDHGARRCCGEAEPDDGDLDGELFNAMVESKSDVSATPPRRSRRCARCAASCSTRAPGSWASASIRTPHAGEAGCSRARATR